jgi:mono/diheme cytochrome c family protein
LSADYVRLVVRRGLEEMPPFRPSEISDSELAELGAYLAKTPPAVR